MRDLPEGIESGAVVDALRRRWKVDVDVAEYAALGGGSYHWEIADRSGRRWFATVDDLDHKAWLGDRAPLSSRGCVTPSTPRSLFASVA